MEVKRRRLESLSGLFLKHLVAFFVLNILVFYVTFAITNALGMSKVAWDNTYIFALNVIGAGIGFGIGVGVLLHKRKNI